MLELLSIGLWPLMLLLPLTLTFDFSSSSSSSPSSNPFHYSRIFPESFLEPTTASGYTHPLGLILGISAVAIGQFFCILYQYSHYKIRPIIQKAKRPHYSFAEGVTTHLFQPEGFLVLGSYLTITWELNLLPPSYYRFDLPTNPLNVALCLVTVDFLQFLMHQIEHRASPYLYKLSHKPHHRFINPRYFDAFNGSLADTILMILIPLLGTANIVRGCSVWDYMCFGSLYANWLCLIHCEFTHVWDPVFRLLGFGTPADHHVHHAYFNFNFGHLFMWWDKLLGTYRSPTSIEAAKKFNKDV